MSDAVTSAPDGLEPCLRRQDYRPVQRRRPVCSGGNEVCAHSLYVESGLADQATEFVASLVTASRLGPTGRRNGDPFHSIAGAPIMTQRF